ncbi:MAG TPA: phytanoyl-CoA dioxygenase family protein [Limnochordia bacterium]|nr:phytanoyl-CoA dioxygenase family protein [Limnochordia bacterium]
MNEIGETLHPFVESAPDAEPAALRERLERDGYLFIRGLLPQEVLLDLRRQALEVCCAHGWLIDGSELMDSLGRPDAYSGHFEGSSAYPDLQRLQAFHALAHHPAIIDLLAGVMASEVLVHPRNIMRVTLPGSLRLTTPVHQDYPLIQGTDRFVTVWFPLGDCSRDLGGLAVASGSHRYGALPIQPAEGTGGLAVQPAYLHGEWHASDFALGDVLIFSALTAHRAFPNVTADRLRLSCDFRYQPVNEPVTWGSLEPHMNLLGWRELYRTWPNDDYKYYWRRLALKVVPGIGAGAFIEKMRGRAD